MVELMASDEKVFVLRRDILDIIFILPIYEVESGMFHISGSKSIYFKRYRLHRDNIIRPASLAFILLDFWRSLTSSDYFIP
jgi:hypothetical protein